MILGVDIGGTKVNIALFKEENKKLVIKQQEQFPSKSYTSLIDILKEFFSNHVITIDKACFGIAGPVIEQKCTVTNLSWNITVQELQAFLGINKVALINDLEATAYGMLYLEDDQFFQLNPKGSKRDGNKAVVAAGTGLGEAQIFFDGTHYHPISCEGGHTDFAPLDPLQDKLLVWLREKFPNHVSYERILCGSGIFLLYQFLCENNNTSFHKLILNANEKEDKSAIVSKLAFELQDTTAIETLDLFCKIYGAEAGNMALKSMSLGGVYVGGGVAPKILPVLQKHFLEYFLEKGRFKALLETMEVKLSLEDKTALLGTAYFARDKL
jgi:glucokinase